MHFIHGPVEAFPPKGFEDFFGVGPYYRFIKPTGPETGGSDVLDRIRNFPKGATAEDQMRELMKDGIGGTVPVPNSDRVDHSGQDAMDYLYGIMEEEGPFDGIIGYSEGATVAATIILHEQRRFETEGRIPTFKCALFFAGWPPMSPDFDVLVLADQSDLSINIPTCHISKYHHKCLYVDGLSAKHFEVGSLDPYLAGSIALFNVCDMDSAHLFDHGKGHTLPRDKHTVKELGDVIRTMISNL